MNTNTIVNAVICGVLGVVVLAFAWVASTQPRLLPYVWPMIIVGLALIAAAAGSQVNVKQPGWTAAGAAAIVAVFVWILKPDASAKYLPYVRGTLKNTQDFKSVHVQLVHGLLVGRGALDEPFQFIAFGSDIDGQTFYITATPAQGQDFIIGCLPISLIQRPDGSPSVDLSVVLQDSKWVVRDESDATKKPLGEFNSYVCPGPVTVADTPQKVVYTWSEAALKLFGIETARAADSIHLAAIVKGLKSPVPDERNAARNTLSKQNDNESIGVVVSGWNPDAGDVDTDYGLILSWVNAIRNDPSVAATLASKLTAPQRRRIVALMGYTDLPVRYSATELTTWLLRGDAAHDGTGGVLSSVSTPITDMTDRTALLSPIGSFDKDKWIVNASTAIVGARCQLSPDQRARLGSVLFAERGHGTTLQEALQGAASQLSEPCTPGM